MRISIDDPMIRRLLFAVVLVSSATVAHAETGQAAWLRYARLDNATADRNARVVPRSILTLEPSAPIQKAREELLAGVRGLLGVEAKAVTELPADGAVVAGTLSRLRQAIPGLLPDGDLPADGFWLKSASIRGARYLVIAGASERGVLYGAFALLRKIALGESLASIDQKEAPYAPIRWVNQWNNLDGSIERGYGGRSIFWESGTGARRSQPRRRIRPPARVARHQRHLDQQRQRQPARARRQSSCRRLRASRTCFGRGACGVALAIDFGSPQTLGEAGDLRSARSVGDRLVEDAGPTRSTRRFPTLAGSC